MSFLRFAFSELLHSKRFAILFLVNLSFGLTSFSALEFLKNSIQTTIMSQSRQVLGADFGISSRHALNEQEQFIVQKNLPQQALATDVIETFSMVTHGQSSALVQIKAVQLTFPFYGQILTEPLKKTSYLEDTESVWIYPELLTLLNARIGDFLKIGTRQFRIAAVVKDDTASNISTNMAPRIYMSLNSLKKTNLVRSGSLAWYSTLYKIPNFSEEQLDSLKNQIYQQLSDNEVQVFTHRSASEQMNRLLNYLSDFLGLISLSSLFIACIGLTFLLSTYLHDKSVSIAILNVLGYSKKKAILFYALQLFAVTLFGAIISVFLAIVSLPFLLQASQTVAAFTILLNVNFTTLFQTLLVGTLGGFCIILPHLIHLIYSPPRQLLSNMPRTHKNIYWQLLLAYIPGALLFYLLSVREMHSVQNGSIFFACFVGSGLLLYGFSYFILSLAQKIKWAPSLAFAWALRDLTRLRISTTTGFLSLALGVFLVNIIPQIRANLQGEIQKPITSKLPSLFLFDIQEEQLNDIQKILKNEHIHLQHLSPLFAHVYSKSTEHLSKKEREPFRPTPRESKKTNLAFVTAALTFLIAPN